MVLIEVCWLAGVLGPQGVGWAAAVQMIFRQNPTYPVERGHGVFLHCSKLVLDLWVDTSQHDNSPWLLWRPASPTECKHCYLLLHHMSRYVTGCNTDELSAHLGF